MSVGAHRPIRFGLIGAGAVANGIADALGRVEGAELVAVTSRSDTRRRSFVDRYPHVTAYDDPTALLERAGVDVAYVATPHHVHREHATLCLEHGVAVVCEKPFAMDATEARAIVELARERRIFCMEAMWMRFVPAVRRFAELVANGSIGEPRVLTADFGMPVAFDRESRFFDPEQGGGALLDRGVYVISLAHMLFGAPTEVEAVSTMGSTGVDEDVGIVMRFDTGGIAILSASLSSATSNSATVAGTRGSLTLAPPFFCSQRLDTRTYAPHVAGSSGPSSRLREIASRAQRFRVGGALVDAARRVRDRPTSIRLPFTGNGYEYQLDEVVRCVRQGELESPLMPLDHTLAVMDICDAVRRA